MRKVVYGALIAVLGGLLVSWGSPKVHSFQTHSTCTDEYLFKLRLQVPVIVDNMESLGKRVYKSQSLTGAMLIHYGGEDGEEVEFSIPALTNRSYSIKGAKVTYDTELLGSPIWTAIGNNKTGVFKKATLSFRFQADPSYNIGTDDPDNTLILQASLTGNQFGRMTGYAAGQLGCGCHAYGHVSPTRTIGPDGATTMVSDIAAVKGTVSLKFKNRRFD